MMFRLSLLFAFTISLTITVSGQGDEPFSLFAQTNHGNRQADLAPQAIYSDKFVDGEGNLISQEYTIKTEVIDAELVTHYYYDNEQRLIAQRYYDYKGELIYNEDGIAIYEYFYDSRGNKTEIRYYDEYKQPYRINFAGPAMIRYNYDQFNRLTRVSYFNEYGELLDIHAAVIEYDYDENNWITEERHFDSDRAYLDYRAPIIRYVYDDRGRILEQKYYDATGNLVNRFLEEDEGDFAVIKYVYNGSSSYAQLYDKNGNLIEY